MKRDLWKGVIRGLPIALGYIPMAISYGVLAVQAGLTLEATVLMSVIVYAGASQFMAVNMILLGTVGIELVLTTFVLNFRHVIMSMAFLNKYPNLSLISRWLLCLGITDETFAVVSLPKDSNWRSPYLAGLMLIAYTSWVGGSLVGGLLATIIPPELGASMSIALYAMFIGLLVPAVRSSIKYGIIALCGALFSFILNYIVDPGWAIVIATMVASMIGLVINKEDVA